MKRSKSPILIAGYYGRRNAGDESILSGILHTLKSLLQSIDVCVISSNPEETRGIHGVRSIAWTDLGALIEEVERSSLIIVGGGGLFHDYWGFTKTAFLSNDQAGISEYGSPLILAYLMGKPSMLYGVGIGPLLNEASLNAVRFLLEITDEVVVRDAGSKQILKEIGSDVHKINVAADPTFCAPSVQLDQEVADQLDCPRPLLGVSLRPWTFRVQQDQWEAEVAGALDHFLELQGGTVVFIPMQDGVLEMEDDVSVCKRVHERMRKCDHAMLIHTEHPLQRQPVLEACDLVLGMRLHACIAAIRGGVPCVAIAYDPKVAVLMERIGMSEHVIGIEALDAEILAQNLGAIYHERSRVKTHLLAASRELARSAEEIGQRAQELIIRGSEPGDKPSSIMPALLLDRVEKLLQVEAELAHSMAQLQDMERELAQANESLVLAAEVKLSIEEQLKDEDIRNEVLRRGIEALDRRLQESNAELNLVSKNLQFADLETERFRANFEQVSQEMETIKSSKGWKALHFTWRIVWRVRDTISRFTNNLGYLHRFSPFVIDFLMKFRSAVRFIRRSVLPIWLRAFLLSIHAYEYEINDRTRVFLFSENENLFPGYEPRQSLKGDIQNSIKFSLIATVRNEAGNVEAWIKSLEAQLRKPDEVVLIDAGSTDGTFELIKHFAQKTDLVVKVYREEGVNIARGRNLAIKRANYNTIVVSDFGCHLHLDYLENIIRPFEIDPKMQVVAGWFEAEATTYFGKRAKRDLVPTLESVNPQNFIPSARSMAFQKEAWRAAGQYPEWLSMTGDDTYFGMELKRTSENWAFVPEACVVWHAPETPQAFWRKLTSWSYGDGESNLLAKRYWQNSLLSWLGTILTMAAIIASSIALFWPSRFLGFAFPAFMVLVAGFLIKWRQIRNSRNLLIGILGQFARSIGFFRGVRQRPYVAVRRQRGVEGIAYILSGVPFDDTGGGARGAQIAKELLRRNYLLVYIYQFPKDEHIDLQIPIWHPRFIHASTFDFDWDAFEWEYEGLIRSKTSFAIVEFPLKDFLPLIRKIRRTGGKIVYERIDDWESSLGGRWYAEKVEEAILKESDLLTATAPVLVKRLERFNHRTVYLLPNAVDLELFDRNKSFAMPKDFPQGAPVIIYTGALWGEWFDWSLLHELSISIPEAVFVLIGDYDVQHTDTSSNVHFLGLKAQEDLPAYLHHADLGIIPWKVNSIAQATSPLKVYEYIAMGLPVVAPCLNTLKDIPQVFCAEDHHHFIKLVEDVQSYEAKEKILDQFLSVNSWKARVDYLLKLMDGEYDFESRR